MAWFQKGKMYKLGEKKPYTSIYGYAKYRIPVFDAETGAEAGWIKEEVTPGIPGQPDITAYYERNGWRPPGKLRFYQSPEALIIAFGGQIETTGIVAVEPKKVIKARKTAKKVAAKKPTRKTAKKPARKKTGRAVKSSLAV